MERMETAYGISFVVSGGYTSAPADIYPQSCSSFLAGMIIVGYTDKQGRMAASNSGPHDAWAPGVDLPAPRSNDGALANYPTTATGTSHGMF
jgi:hypothetical protein